MEVLDLLHGDLGRADARRSGAVGGALVSADLRPQHGYIMRAVARHRYDKIKAVSGKRGQQDLKITARSWRLAEAGARAIRWICARVPGRTVGIRCTGPTRQRRDAIREVAKERIADLLNPLIVDDALAREKRKPARGCFVTRGGPHGPGGQNAGPEARRLR